MLICNDSWVATGSASSRSCSPSAPRHTSTTSRSPTAATAWRSTQSAPAGSAASYARVSIVRRGPASRRAASSNAAGRRPARMAVPPPSRSNSAAMAWPMSEVPPNTRTLPIRPTPSLIRSSGSSLAARRPVRSSRRSRSEASTPAGSSRLRTARQHGSSGYIAPRRSGRNRLSLTRYTRPPAVATRSSRTSSTAPRPAAEAGKSNAKVQPGWGNDSAAGSAAPSSFSTASDAGVPAALVITSASTSVCSAPIGTTNWYCTSPDRPYKPGQPRSRVQRMQDGGQRLEPDTSPETGRRQVRPVGDRHRGRPHHTRPG